MRILVLSDSHGDFYSLKKAIDSQPEAKTIFFLGDGEYDINMVEKSFPNKIFIKVKGNCDFYSTLPASAIDEIGGVRIYATHGYVENVKYGRSRLRQVAADNKATIALYGHTHIPDTTYDDGIHLINPGSIRMGEYAVVDIVSNGIMPILMKVK